jgi:magnesium transporter
MHLQAMCESGAGEWVQIDDLDDVLRLRRDPETLVWVQADASAASEDDVRALAQEFELDPLAVEDALSPRQRPKLETYTAHRFVVAYQLDEDDDDQLAERQIAGFVGEGFAIVLHHGAERLVQEARKRVESAGPERVRTADRLLHALIDTVVDDDEVIATRIASEVEDLEDDALMLARARERRASRTSADEERPPSQYRLYTLKQQMSMLRRFALPLGPALERRLERTDGQVATDETEKLFRDVYDHVVRIAAQVRSTEELTNGVLELGRSVQADTLNEINKKLTGWAAVVAGSALIAGLYGTNYRLLPPHSIGSWGFVFMIGLMAATSGTVYLFFKRKGWI